MSHRRNVPTLRSLLLIALCVCAVHSRNVENSRQKRTTENSCDNVRPFFQARNIPLRHTDTPKGNICGGQCCGPDGEALLRKQGQEVFATMLRHNSRSLQGLLNSTATTLQSHVIELAGQSQNNTLLLFTQVFKRKAALAKDPIINFYADIRRYIQINNSQDAIISYSGNIDIVSTVTRFFTDMFPLMYHRNLPSSKDFSFEYKQCIRETMSEVQPFGDIPRQVGQSLSKSLDATRQLLQAFGVGIQVLNATDTLIIEDNGKSNAECHDALMKMSHCPKCIGLKEEPKPCSGYCLNVLRGCLTRYVAELDSPWNGYVEGIERLVTAMRQHNNEAGVNVDSVIRNLDKWVSEAIMHAMEKEKDIDTKVKRQCGPYKLSEKEDPLLGEPTGDAVATKSRNLASSRQFSSFPETIVLHFLNSIAKSRGFYGNLADNLCQDESFAEPKDQHCWNGERIGEYTKTVVGAGLDMQNYNPEVKPSTTLQNVDPRVAHLADKLRHVHQMVMSSLGAVGFPESDSYMQGDGEAGSGSGGGPNFTDDDDDMVKGGSGSGNGPDEKEIITEMDSNDLENNRNVHKEVASSAGIELPSLITTILLLCTTLVLRYS